MPAVFLRELAPTIAQGSYVVGTLFARGLAASSGDVLFDSVVDVLLARELARRTMNGMLVDFVEGIFLRRELARCAHGWLTIARTLAQGSPFSFAQRARWMHDGILPSERAG